MGTEQVTLDDLWRDLSKKNNAVLMCDYDGTLAPFRANRFEAEPYDGVVELLKEIWEGGSKLVIITGRPVSELLSLMPFALRLEIWGAHGLEYYEGNLESSQMGELSIHRIPIHQETQDIFNSVYEFALSKGLRDIMEAKYGSIAFHWRGLPSDRINKIRKELGSKLADLVDDSCLKLHEFDGGLEIRIKGTTKGTAVERITEKSHEDTVFAYLGDDFTDEDAFRAVKKAGYGILVRKKMRESEADIWLKPPGELIGFLTKWSKSAGVCNLRRK